MAFTVLRIAKLKSWGVVGGAGAHNFRRRPTPNADPERTQQNRYLMGQPEDYLPNIVRAKIGDQTIRKNAVLAVEMVMSASPEYFRPNAPEQGGMWDEQHLMQWERASMNWLRQQYGDRVVSAVLHLDEQTPHIQAVIVPLDDKGKLNCRALFGGSRQTLRDLQTSYAKSVQHLGIQRGIEGSKAQHCTIAEYYRNANATFEPLPEVKTKAPTKLRDEPQKPGLFARRDTKAYYEADRARWRQEQAAYDAQRKQWLAEVRAQRDAAVEMAKRHQAQAVKVTALAKEVQALKAENSKLLTERQALKAEADRLRGTKLADVLTCMYGAQEAADSRPTYRTRKFEIEGRAGNIAITGELWTDNATGQGGKGAINLVMHLEGYGQDRYRDAVRLLAEHFGTDRATADIGRFVALNAPVGPELMRQPPPLPEPRLSTWPRARRYLEQVRKIPAALIDWASKRGLIYSDERANLVFRRDRDTGCFKRGSYDPKNRPAFKQTLGRDALPFVLPGNDGQVFITEGPIDALSLKAMHPTSTVLATGGNCPIERLKPYLDSATDRIFLAQDADPAGNHQADALKTAYKPRTGVDMVRWSPTIEQRSAKDWNAVLTAKPGLSAFALDPHGAIAMPKLKPTYVHGKGLSPG